MVFEPLASEMKICKPVPFSFLSFLPFFFIIVWMRLKEFPAGSQRVAWGVRGMIDQCIVTLHVAC